MKVEKNIVDADVNFHVQQPIAIRGDFIKSGVVSIPLSLAKKFEIRGRGRILKPGEVVEEEADEAVTDPAPKAGKKAGKKASEEGK